MNKQAKTYQTPAGMVTGDAERHGALWYGSVLRGGLWHEVACIRVDENDGMLLVSGPSFYGWVSPDEVVQEAE